MARKLIGLIVLAVLQERRKGNKSGTSASPIQMRAACVSCFVSESRDVEMAEPHRRSTQWHLGDVPDGGQDVITRILLDKLQRVKIPYIIAVRSCDTYKRIWWDWGPNWVLLLQTHYLFPHLNGQTSKSITS